MSTQTHPGEIQRGASRADGFLRLRFEARANGDHTILAESEQQSPLQVVRAFPLEDGATLVHLHNLSGGVLGGDRLEVTISVERQAQAQVTSTGATRIYRSRNNEEAARAKLQITVEDGGLIEYLPDQLIPFAGSRYQQDTHIELGKNAGLFWWEIVSPGREARNELFAYDLLLIRATINALGRPIAR